MAGMLPGPVAAMDPEISINRAALLRICPSINPVLHLGG